MLIQISGTDLILKSRASQKDLVGMVSPFLTQLLSSKSLVSQRNGTSAIQVLLPGTCTLFLTLSPFLSLHIQTGLQTHGVFPPSVSQADPLLVRSSAVALVQALEIQTLD